jgi:hypothetical protein
MLLVAIANILRGGAAVEEPLSRDAADEDEAGARWAEGVAREWAAELTDPREDIYSFEDGEPVQQAKPHPSRP